MGTCVSVEEQTVAPTLTLYGARSCHWCRRMHDELERVGVPHDTVWCDAGGACNGFARLPVLVLPDGRQMVGYHPAALVKQYAFSTGKG